MGHFRRFYLGSTAITCVIVVLSVLISFGSGQVSAGYSIGGFLIGAVPLIPIFRKGGIVENPRLAISISTVMALAFSLLLLIVFIEFVQTKGGEGPKGKGAPGAIIMAMVFFAIAFVCPWLLTALRGLRLWNHPIKRTEPCSAGNPS